VEHVMQVVVVEVAYKLRLTIIIVPNRFQSHLERAVWVGPITLPTRAIAEAARCLAPTPLLVVAAAGLVAPPLGGQEAVEAVVPQRAQAAQAMGRATAARLGVVLGQRARTVVGVVEVRAPPRQTASVIRRASRAMVATGLLTLGSRWVVVVAAAVPALLDRLDLQELAVQPLGRTA